jgi:STE24 endopeptidase
MFVFPTWIAPLFNKFSPLPDGPLKERIQNLVKRVGVNAKEVFVVDGSKRSKHANAYFTGFGKNRRIVLYDTLLQQLNEDEIEAVLAHELGHLKHKHVLKGLFLSLLLSLLFFYVLGLLAVDPDFYMKLGIPFNFMLPTGGTALILFMLVMPYVVFVFSPFGSWFSRKHEFEADRFAAHYSKAEYLASGLLKLYKENAASVVSDPLYVLFYASHPPIIQRLEALKQLKPTVV